MERLTKVLQKVNSEILNCDDGIVSDGIVDSVDLMEIIAEIEEEFQIEIPMEMILPENFDSVDAMWSMIEALL